MQSRFVDHMELWPCCPWKADMGANSQTMPVNQGTQGSCHQACLGCLGVYHKLDHWFENQQAATKSWKSGIFVKMRFEDVYAVLKEEKVNVKKTEIT